MMTTFSILNAKLRLFLLLSSLCAGSVTAHEVLPAIADVSAENGVLRFEMRLNLEAQLSDIDLDVFSDTDEAENNRDYEALRAEPAVAIALRANRLLSQWNALPLISAEGAAVTMQLDSSETMEEPNLELPRETVVRLTGILPSGAQNIVVSWPKGSGSLVVRQFGVEDPFTGFLDGGTSSPEIDLKGGGAMTQWQAFVRYIPVGFDHILPKGLDHILFVLGLFFLSTRAGPLLWQISAFTLAHTVTLALGALGWVNVPAQIVEPLIAASIAFVAVENILAKGLTPWRPFVVFGFGLLHGLGFASVLGAFGLPQGQFIPALIGFNIGVELGQLTVIALAFALVGWFARKDWYRRAIAIPASVVIALVGVYWVVERTLL